MFYYAGTFVGVTWLAQHYLRWLESCLGAPGLGRPGTKWGWALLLARGTLVIAEVSREPSRVMGISSQRTCPIFLSKAQR